MDGVIIWILVVCEALTWVFSPTVGIVVNSHNCEIDTGCSSVTTLTGLSEAECRRQLANFTRAQYSQGTSTCRVTNCNNIVYTSATSILMFDYANAMCPDIFLRRMPQTEPSYSDKLELDSYSLTDCFFACTDDATCIFFIYDSKARKCTLDIDCSPGCTESQPSEDLDTYSVTCAPSCPMLYMSYDDLYVHVQSVLIGSVAIYFCVSGKIISPITSTVRTCQSDGTWSGTEPICIDGSSPSCSALSPPPSCSISMYPDGSLWAIYSFSAGLYVRPTDRRVCISDNTWSTPAPSADTLCPLLTSPAHGAVNTIVLPDGTTAVWYTCNPGFEPTVYSRYCPIALTFWSHDDPTCVPISGTTTTTTTKTTSVPSTTTTTSTTTQTTTTPTTTTTLPTTTTTSTTTTTLPTTTTTSPTTITTSPTTTTTLPTTTTSPTTTTTSSTAIRPGTTTIPSTTATTSTATTTTFVFPYRTRNSSLVSPKPIYITPCRCAESKTFVNMTLLEIVELLRIDTRVDPKTTSQARRKFTSASDDRTSAKVLGAGGIVIIVIVCGVILANDVFALVCPNLKRIGKQSVSPM